MVCRIKQRFQIADMTLWSKVKVSNTCPWLKMWIPLSFFDLCERIRKNDCLSCVDYNISPRIWIRPRNQGSKSNILENCHIAHSTNSSLVFSWDVFLFSATIASDVQIKTKVSDSLYDLVVKGQGHTYLELVYGSNANSISFQFFSFLT